MTNQSKSFPTNNSIVYLGNDVFEKLSDFLEQSNPSKIFILVDENSLSHCATELISQVDMLSSAEIIEIESGEENKNIDICYQLWKTLVNNQADRKSLIINVGGGVVTDMGGFVASTFKRGIDFINVPTTLLAQIDASVGGKVGVDMDGLKNMIGLFNEPKAVFLYPGFLKTLDKKQMLSGYAEALKHGLIKDKKYWQKLKNGMLSSTSFWFDLIASSVEIKNTIVISDPNEIGERKLLNFGHTVGHAIETYFLSGDTLPLLHGEAVAIGIICESYLSNQLNGLPESELDEIAICIHEFYKLPEIPIENYSEIVELMKNDKKNIKSKLNFTLLKSIGEASVNHEVEKEVVFAAFDYFNATLNSTK